MKAEYLTTRKVEDAIHAAASKFANDPHDYEDIAQECRETLIKKVSDDDAQSYWLIYKKCWSRAHRHWRDAERYTAHINGLLQIAEQADQDEQTYDEVLSDFLGGLHPSDSIEDEISNREELETIRTIAQSLTPRQERVLWLRLKGYSYKQIAKQLGTCPQTVHENTVAIKKAFIRYILAPALFTEAIA